jgi:hypothetical protein
MGFLSQGAVGSPFFRERNVAICSNLHGELYIGVYAVELFLLSSELQDGLCLHLYHEELMLRVHDGNFVALP